MTPVQLPEVPEPSSGVSVSMVVRLYAGEVLVAELDDPELWCRVFGAILNPKPPCGLCHKTPRKHCCNATQSETNSER